MGAEEFALHMAYLAAEPPPALQWASLMAATFNGPRIKKDKQPFRAEEFWPDPWVPEPPAPPAKPGAPDKKPMLAPDLSAMRGMRVAKRRG